MFKSRFGIAGRDFILTLRRERIDDDKYERLLLGGGAVPNEFEPINYFDRPELKREYEAAVSNTVHGVMYTAGYYIEHEKSTNRWKMVYVNDIDPATRGVPQWIVNRVKIDQLKTVLNIPQEVVKLIKETGGKVIPVPYIGNKRIKD